MARNRGNRPSVRWGISRQEAEREGYRSTFECAVGRQLKAAKVAHEYESVKLAISIPAGRTHRCLVDPTHEVGRATVYSPDFVFPSAKLFIETKGRFDPDDRYRAIAVTTQHGDWQYRLLFESDNKLTKASKTRYSDWCAKRGIVCAIGLIPAAWLKELK